MASPSSHEVAESQPLFAHRLGRLRTQLGLTQQVLAERSGLSVRGISDLERGLRHPRSDTVQRIARALGVNDAYLSGPRTRLLKIPAALDAFVDRERELERLGSELRSPGARLITITGAPGVGKSRLARELATREESAFPHGAAFIRLCVLRKTRDVSLFLARQLGCDSVSALEEYLRHRQFLLVLDNAEHLAGIADPIVALSESAPGLTVLVTSRNALLATGEHVRELEPFSLPVDDVPETVLAAPSTLLFITRAQERFARSFALADAPALARIVRALDGLPLALELAAMQLSSFSLEHLAANVEQIVGSATGPLDRPVHSRSLAGALEWSLALLTAGQRRFLARLSIFVGMYTIEAAAFVGAVSVRNAERDVGTLRDMNLLVQTPDPSLIAMLATVRSYLLMELDRNGDLDEARERHAHWYECTTVSEHSSWEALTAPIRIIAERGVEDNLRHARHSRSEVLAISRM